MPKKINIEKYTYRLTWSEEDNEYVGLCVEFPSLSFLAKSRKAALSGIEALVDDVVHDMIKNKEDVPEPLAVREYKGKIAVRVSPDLHRELSVEAAEQNISLNRLISQKLARH